MTTLYRTANATYSRLPSSATLGRFHPETCGGCTLFAGAIAIGSIGPRVRQVTRVGLPDRHFGWRRLDDQ